MRNARIVALMALLAASVTATAATDGPAGAREPLVERIDANRDGVLARAEIEAFVRERVQAADRDGDGAFSVEELRAVREQRRAARAQRRLARLDADHDGRVSVAEIAERRTALMMRFDHDGDGAISPGERESARAEWRDRRGD